MKLLAQTAIFWCVLPVAVWSQEPQPEKAIARLKLVAQLIPQRGGDPRVIREVLSTKSWDDAVLTDLATLPDIELIHLSHKSKTSAEGWRRLRTLPRLRSLELFHAELGDSAILGIGTIDSLKRLVVLDNNLSGSSFDSLGELKNLEDLMINGSGIRGGSFKFLGKLENLGWADLSTTQFNDEDAAQIAKLPKLSQLELTDTQITDKALAPVLKAPALKYVFLSSPFLTDRANGIVKERFEIGRAYRVAKERQDPGKPK